MKNRYRGTVAALGAMSAPGSASGLASIQVQAKDTEPLIQRLQGSSV